MTPEYRIRELEEACGLYAATTERLEAIIDDQKKTILFLAKMHGKALAERDHARDFAVAAEVEVARLGGWQPS